MEPVKKNISDIRNDYKLKQLDKTHVLESPIQQLENWVHEAVNASLYEPTAMTLSTVSNLSKPSSRVVLLKGIVPTGLVFFTNYESRKGKELLQNPLGAINFFWPELERQVRIEGRIEKVSEEESNEYFHSRPRTSQLGALASPQSEVIEGREVLEKSIEKLTKEYEGKSILKPAHWGGYILIPDYFEFWQGRSSRLHDRIIYVQEGANWKIKRLAP
jgi:pyridoxamine 5'-phosphate oxidase